MYTFIVNPHARSGRGGKVWEELEPVLKNCKTAYQVFFPRYQRHATQFVKELTSDLEEHVIVALGGDGTVNEIINGIADYSKVTLGYIPVGSSNDFARYFQLNLRPQEALRQILHPSGYSYMNVGCLCCNGKRKYFAVSSGIGYDAAVCHQAVISRMKVFLNKLGLGKLTYVTIALDQIFRVKLGEMTLTLNGEKQFTFERAYFAAAMNHPYEGGGFKFCPAADPCDDILNIIVVAGLSRMKTLCLLPTAFKGWHTRFHGIHTFTCKTAEIECSEALPVHTDGEPIFLKRKLHISLRPDKLRIITG